MIFRKSRVICVIRVISNSCSGFLKIESKIFGMEEKKEQVRMPIFKCIKICSTGFWNILIDRTPWN